MTTVANRRSPSSTSAWRGHSHGRVVSVTKPCHRPLVKRTPSPLPSTMPAAPAALTPSYPRSINHVLSILRAVRSLTAKRYASG